MHKTILRGLSFLLLVSLSCMLVPKPLDMRQGILVLHNPFKGPLEYKLKTTTYSYTGVYSTEKEKTGTYTDSVLTSNYLIRNIGTKKMYVLSITNMIDIQPHYNIPAGTYEFIEYRSSFRLGEENWDQGTKSYSDLAARFFVLEPNKAVIISAYAFGSITQTSMAEAYKKEVNDFFEKNGIKDKWPGIEIKKAELISL